MTFKRIIAILCVIVMLGALLAGCGNSGGSSGGGGTSGGGTSGGGDGSDRSKTFVLGMGYRPSSVDPHDNRNYSTTIMHEFIWETLIYSNRDGEGYHPRLAESWEFNEDGTEWSFKLRENVTFHKSGNPFTADDIVYSVERIKAPGSTLNASVTYSDLAGVEKIDDYNVVFKFNIPMPEGESVFSTLRFIDSVAHQEMGDAYFNDQYCSGTGPWMLKEWIDGQHVIYEKAPNYWNKDEYDPYFEEVQLLSLSEPASAIAAHISGTVSGYVVNGGISNDLKGLYVGHEDRINVISIEGSAFINMGTNYKDGCWFQNDKFREAFHLCINRQMIVDSIYNGAGSVPIGAVQYVSIGYDESLGPVPYDPERAKQLLEESGYNGERVELMYSNTLSQGEEIALTILDMATAVGINLDVVLEEHSVLSTRLTDSDYEMYLISGAPGEGLIVRQMQNSLLSTNNARIQDWPRYDEWVALVDEITAAGMDKAKVEEIGQRVNAFRFENFFHSFPLVNRNVTQALDRGIVGINLYPDGVACFAYVDWDPSQA